MRKSLVCTHECDRQTVIVLLVLDIAIGETAGAVEQERSCGPAKTATQGAEIFDVGMGLAIGEGINEPGVPC